MKSFNWDFIHNKCNLNNIRDKLWLNSRFYGLRFENILNLILDEYYFEALMMMLLLLENILASIAGKINLKFEELINIAVDPDKREIAHSLRKLRNAMVHKYLFKYYVRFDGEKNIEYPLDEIDNYMHILERLFPSIISCFDSDYNEKVLFEIKEYSFEELLKQYGLEKEGKKLLNLGISDNTPINEIETIKKRNELKVLMLLNNSSPVSYYVQIFKQLFNK